MQHYALGFAFSSDKEKCLFIRKNRPTWQANKLNGVGGKVERNESPVQAMEREFLEETGLRISASKWRHFGMLLGIDFQVWCFTTTGNIGAALSLTDEKLEAHNVSGSEWRQQCLSNVAGLVHAAQDPDEPFLMLAYRESAVLAKDELNCKLVQNG